MSRQINTAGKELIKHFEGCRLKAYKDIVGVLTIGYGHTGKDVREGLEIDSGTANDLLEKDLQKFCHGVEDLVKVSITDNQFAALVAFAYNIGLNALSGSTLLKKLNAGDLQGASEQFLRWDKAGGKPVAGLTRRRTAEKDLFLTAV
jgi:lysozyme